MRYTDRTRIVQRQRCPRSYYWGYEYEGRGIKRKGLAIPLATGSYVHHGLAQLLLGVDVDQAVTEALKGYAREVAKYGLEIESTEQLQYVVAEQSALIEALVRLAAKRIIPVLLDKFNVITVEQELQTEITPGVTLQGRTDALLLGKVDQRLNILSWKTKASWAEGKRKERALEDAEHDDQGLSETWLTEQWLVEHPRLPQQTDGVMMIWLIKGERKEYPADSGQYVQWSPLIRGYRKFDANGKPEYAWRYEWVDAQGGKHRLGKGWERFDVWQTEGGVRAWIDLLDAGVQPEAGDCLSTQYVWPATFYRHPEQVEGWIQQVSHSERVAIEAATYLDLNRYYPQHRHSCSYPSRCQFYTLCWGSQYDREHPMDAGYVQRKPHHEPERIAMGDINV